MRGSVVLVIALTACNTVYGLDGTRLREYSDAMPRPDADPRVDRDVDGIKDIEDPCIAPWTDGPVDSDGDMAANSQDPCPFDSSAQQDTDGDGVGDACDPDAGGTRVLCVMAFTDPDLSALLWHSDGGWDHLTARQMTGRNGLLAAQWPFEAETGKTAYQIAGYVFPGTRRIALIPRLNGEGEPQVGCSLVFEANTWSVATNTSSAVINPATSGIYYRIYLTAVLDSANSGYECIGTVLGVGTARVHADEGVLYGNLGLVAEQASLAGSVGVSGLMIYAW